MVKKGAVEGQNGRSARLLIFENGKKGLATAAAPPMLDGESFAPYLPLHASLHHYEARAATRATLTFSRTNVMVSASRPQKRKEI